MPPYGATKPPIEAAFSWYPLQLIPPRLFSATSVLACISCRPVYHYLCVVDIGEQEGLSLPFFPLFFDIFRSFFVVPRECMPLLAKSLFQPFHFLTAGGHTDAAASSPSLSPALISIPTLTSVLISHGAFSIIAIRWGGLGSSRLELRLGWGSWFHKYSDFRSPLSPLLWSGWGTAEVGARQKRANTRLLLKYGSDR